AVADRQDVGIESIEHRFEQRAGKYRRAEIAHALRIDRVVIRTIPRLTADAHLEVELQPLANFRPLPARDRQTLRVPALRQCGNKAAMAVAALEIGRAS